MKRTLSLIILISMTLHCAGRLGILSYLYQQRHAIAYTAGIIAEIPIALCNSNYHFSEEINIPNENSDSTPVHIPNTVEINLFVPTYHTLFPGKNIPLQETLHPHPYEGIPYSSALSEIFQPPRIS